MITDEYPSRNSQYLTLLTVAKPDLTLSLCWLANRFPPALILNNFSPPVDEVRSKHAGAC